MRCKIFILIMGLIVILSGCLSVNDKFLIENLRDDEKSTILTNKGTAMFEILLETEDDFRLIPEIQKCYEVALEFNPTNTKTLEYSEKLDLFIIETVEAYIEKINTNREKVEERTNDDDYMLCFYIIKAYELDSDNEEIGELRKETRPILDALIADYILEANSIKENAIIEADIDTQEAMLVEALAIYAKISGIDPGNKQIDKESESAVGMLIAIMDDKILYLRSRIADQYFTASLGDVNSLAKYNKTVNNALEAEIDELQYLLYFEWAKYMYDEGDLDVAYSKANAAIYFIEKQEAIELRNTINSKLAAYRERRNEAALVESFNDFIDQIDALIADGELAIAYQRMREIEGTLSDSSHKSQVSERKSIITGKLEPIYQAGVSAYVQEDFQVAIYNFSIVVDIDNSYQDAAAYLEKSKAKQALLDSY